MKRRELKLHIGLPKTGSTSIQALLKQNTDFLSKNGIYFPDIFGETAGQTSLVAYGAVTTGLKFSKFVRSFHGIRSEEDIEPFKARFQARFEECLENNDASTVVISSELFYSELRNVDQCKALKGFLENYFSDIKVIAYLRPQDRWVNSRVSQTAKLGGVSTIDEMIDAKVNNYYEFLKKWWQVFGKENIILRTLEPKRLYEQDLYSDFLKLIGAEKSSDLIIPERKNEGLSIESVLFLQKFNHIVPYFREHQIRNLDRVGMTETIQNFSLNKSKDLLTQEQINLIQTKYFESNEKLRALFHPRRKFLFLKSENKKAVKEDLDVDDLMEITAYLWTQQQRKINNLRRIVKRHEDGDVEGQAAK